MNGMVYKAKNSQQWKSTKGAKYKNMVSSFRNYCHLYTKFSSFPPILKVTGQLNEQ